MERFEMEIKMWDKITAEGSKDQNARISRIEEEQDAKIAALEAKYETLLARG